VIMIRISIQLCRRLVEDDSHLQPGVSPQPGMPPGGVERSLHVPIVFRPHSIWSHICDLRRIRAGGRIMGIVL
jgi:hypothetical protein